MRALYKTVGWEPTCDCGIDDAVSCMVLDPFGGAGTTGLVADRMNRDAILIELNPEYARMAYDRIHKDAPLFIDVTLEEHHEEEETHQPQERESTRS